MLSSVVIAIELVRIVILFLTLFISSCAKFDKPLVPPPVSFTLSSQGYEISQSPYLTQLIQSLQRGEDPADIYIVRSPSAFSFTSEKREVFISTELLKKLPSESALGFILCHELSHIKRNHFSKEPSQEIELIADNDAIICMFTAGYDVMEAKKALFAEHSVKKDSHPSSDIRWNHCMDVILQLPVGMKGIIDTERGKSFRSSL